jgi:hypothetical protein
MRRVLLVVLLACIPFCRQPLLGQAPGVGIQTSHKPKQQSRFAGDDGQTSQRGTQQLPLIVETHPRPESQEQAAEAQKEKDQADFVNRWTLRFTGAVAVFTGLLVWIGWNGVGAALKTLNAIERQGQLMEVAQGASVGIVGINFTDPKPELNVDNTQAAFERSVFRITMKNTGASKALKVRLTVNMIIEGIPGLITTPEDIKNALASDIHPDVLTERTEMFSERLPNAKGVDWKYAVAGKLRLDGTLVYEDIFGNDFETEWMARAMGTSQVHPFAVRFDLISNEKKVKTRRPERQNPN